MTFRDPQHDGGPGDGADADGGEAVGAEEVRLYCAACGHEVTRADLAIRLDGRHRHFCRNPLGIDFKVRLFGDAPGARPVGPPSTRATWFSGYAWRLAACGGCREHLGWMYEGAGPPRVFFGLIGEALTERPR